MLTAALLLLSTIATDVSRARTIAVPRSIERTVARLAIGLAATYGDEARLPSVATLLEGNLGIATIRDSRLLVDGERTGSPVRRVLRGLATLGLLVLDLADSGDSVELRYTLWWRGLAIQRSVVVQEGQIVSRAALSGPLGPQGRVKRIWLTARATETPRGTTIRLTATARVHTGLCARRSRSRCGLVNQLAAAAIARQLDAALLEAEREGRRMAARGHDAALAATWRCIDRLLAIWK